ncbi:unnamed protein product [Urochloa decumbens]|uniref:MULE transposase domain-containing protein n=1 Tax=Urochloa decumbens TaxID=240449 RepID=A0ABC9B4L3_9POAL
MSAQTQTLEELAEYEYIIERTFHSEDQGYEFFNAFARNKGFSLRKGKAKIADGDANAVLKFMKQKQLEDSEFFFDYQTSSTGCLLNLFWCDGQSRLDYQAFADLVIFDSTYRTNRYKMPFVSFVGMNHHRSTTIFACAIVSHETVESFEWLLRTLLVAMYNKEPRSIITDGDRAMRKAIRAVLPNTDHRLCAWHIERNAARYLHHSMIPGFRKLIYMRGTPETFESKWASFLKKHNTTGKRRRRRKYRRCTLNAKSGSTLDIPDHVNSMKGTRLSELLMLAKPIFEEAACSIDEYLRWKEILEHERKEKRKRDDIDGEFSTHADQDNNLKPNATPINVQDPETVQSKGAPKRMKSFLDQPKPKRRCSECKSTEHDIRTCPRIKRRR